MVEKFVRRGDVSLAVPGLLDEAEMIAPLDLKALSFMPCQEEMLRRGKSGLCVLLGIRAVRRQLMQADRLAALDFDRPALGVAHGRLRRVDAG